MGGEAGATVAIVGAGPFGLSVGAWLGDDACVYGRPMQTWRTVMPPDMLLRSAWEETSLSDPRGAGSIDAWAQATGEPRQEPIPLETFLRYAAWFRENFVPCTVTEDVAQIERTPGGFLVRTAGGDETHVTAVVIAVGVTPFPYAPPALAPLVAEGVGFAAEPRDFSALAGKRVVVVGAGQSGLETAALAARAGATVEVLARSQVRWFADREPHHDRGPIGNRLYRLAYPVVGYGPPILNRLVLHPDLFAALPQRWRTRLTRRLLRPGGSPWVRSMLGDGATITEGAAVRVAERRDGGIRLELEDGTTREADHAILATGFRFSVDGLGFLADALRGQIAVDDGWPLLDRWLESSVPGIFFVGYPAEGRFGPLSRFVLGTAFMSRRVCKGVRRRVGAAPPAARAGGR